MADYAPGRCSTCRFLCAPCGGTHDAKPATPKPAPRADSESPEPSAKAERPDWLEEAAKMWESQLPGLTTVTTQAKPRRPKKPRKWLLLGMNHRRINPDWLALGTSREKKAPKLPKTTYDSCTEVKPERPSSEVPIAKMLRLLPATWDALKIRAKERKRSCNKEIQDALNHWLKAKKNSRPKVPRREPIATEET